jgi:hypothetical protein
VAVQKIVAGKEISLCMHTRCTGYNKPLEASRIAVVCRRRAATNVLAGARTTETAAE